MTTRVENGDDGFEFVPAKKATGNGHKTKRIYVGNLPVVEDLEAQLQDMLNQLDIPTQRIEVGSLSTNNSNSKRSTHAMIQLKDSSASSIERAMQAIRQNSGSTWPGRRLTIEREKNKPNNHQHHSAHNNKHSNSAGGSKKSAFKSSWGQPSKPKKKNHPSPTKISNSTQTSLGTASITDTPAMSIDESSKVIGEIVADELAEISTRDEATTTALASTAAVSMIAAMMGGVEAEMKIEKEGSDTPLQETHVDSSNDGASQNKEEPDFRAQLAKPMSALLAEFGEADPDWKNKKVTEALADDNEDDPAPALHNEEEEEEPQVDSSSDPSLNRLTKHGKAPIHVELISFGYHHGAPPATRNGWSHSQPLAVYDCRPTIEPVPAYLEWQDGLSGNIKRILISQSNGGIRDEARQLAQKIVPALKEAIETGHGYASPLIMTIHIGSHHGKHRSVVLSELAATEVRKHLRTNKDNQITQPVSVGTVHLHKDRRTLPSAKDDQGGSSRQKNRYDLEGDW